MSLTRDQAAQVKNNTLSLITLSEDSGIGMLQSSKFLLVALAFTLKLLGDLLLEDEGLEGIIALLLCARKASGEASSIILLLVDETSETSVLTLVVLNLDLEFLSLFGKLLSERLELEELGKCKYRISRSMII
jgi:hypothetical protein